MRNLLIFSILCLSLGLQAQMSIRLDKPQHIFFFAGINSQIKLLDASSGGKSGFELSNYGTKNLLMLQMIVKNRNLLQKGYTKNVALNSFSVLLNTESEIASMGNVSFEAFTRFRFRVNLLANFATKWDRTTFAIGTKAVPYGHNPRVDGFFSFPSQHSRRDLGFNNDFGISVRVPVHKSIDLDASITSGGYLQTPIFGTRMIHPSESNNLIVINKESYKKTVLTMARFGTAPFKRNEFGIYGAVGHIISPFTKNETDMILRVGGDYTFKYRDGFRFTQQISYGMYHPDATPASKAFTTTGIHTSFESLFWGRLFISGVNAITIKKETGKASSMNATVFGVLGFVFQPNLQLRTNFYADYTSFSNTPKTYGAFLQVIAGIGQR